MSAVRNAGGKRGGPKLSWYWSCYETHPASDHVDLRVRQTNRSSGGKKKVYCKCCLEVDVANVMHREATDQANNHRTVLRTRDEIVESLWANSSEDEQRGWRWSATTTMLNHLRDCQNVDASTRELAAAELNKGTTPGNPNTPSKRNAGHPPTSVHAHTYIPSRRTTFPPSISVSSSMEALDPTISFDSDSGPADGYPGITGPYSDSSASSSVPASPASIASSLSQFPLLSQLPSDTLWSSEGHHTSQRTSSASSVLPHPRSHRTIHRTASQTNLRAWDTLRPWGPSQQDEFERHVARLTASANFALSWVENPDWLAFLARYIPEAKYLGRKALTTRVLPKIVEEMRARVRTVVKGREVTIAEDGWTGISNVHLLAFMLVLEGNVYTIRVHDASEERKTADNLLKLLEEVFKLARDEYQTIPVSIVTDASGESRKARRMFAIAHPDIIVVDCYAHQINLIVGDYFKSNSECLEFLDTITDLISFLRNKSILLAILRQAQVNNNLPVLTIIRAVLTRWTSHYSAFRRLLDVHPALNIIVTAELAKEPADRKIIIGDTKAKARARQMIAHMQNPLMWKAITRIVRHLEPLAIATNVIQGNTCSLATVLMTFGWLMKQYKEIRYLMDDGKTRSPTPDAGVDAILKSLEARWAKADQEVFVAAVLINPFCGTHPFKPSAQLTHAGLSMLYTRLWRRFYGDDTPPTQFLEELSHYFDKRGIYEGLEQQCQLEESMAHKEGRKPDPLVVLNRFHFPGYEARPFIKFARRLLSICANSASCERLFSLFGSILTKLRSRLSTKVLTELAELKMHIRDEHVRDSDAKQRMKRRFESPHGEPPKTPSHADSSEASSSPSTLVSEDESCIDDAEVSSRPQGSFRSYVERCIQQVNDDADPPHQYNTMSSGLPTFATTFGTYQNTSLEDLFNFDNTYWSKRYSALQKLSLDEEMALYQLLDYDADGEEDPDIELDGTTEEMMAT